MEVVLQEARDSYPQQIIVDLKSESSQDLENNVANIVEWINQWLKDNSEEDNS
jgi:adenylate kinase